jgi:uncharacterized protein (DUF305 family)
MAFRSPHAGRIRQTWAGLAAATLLLMVHPSAQGAPDPVATPPSAPVPGMGWGAGPMGQRSADARFIVMMIPHHDGAIAMADLAITRANRPQIKALAQQIKTSQTTENAQMRSWYRQWYGTDVPTWAASGMGMGPGSGMGSMGSGMRMGMGSGMGMPGMATSLEVLKLAPDFDRAFIEQMIPHHRMGVMMASHAQWNTQRSELRTLQAARVKAQSETSAQMEL